MRGHLAVDVTAEWCIHRAEIIPIPMHGGKDVSVGLIRAIIREVGVTPDEWLAL